MRLKAAWPVGLVFALWCLMPTTASEKDTSADQLQHPNDSKSEGSAGGRGCPFYGPFLHKDTRCFLSEDTSQSPQTAGENSVCHVYSGPQPDLFRCKTGTWIREDPKAETPLAREKKGWWRRRRRRHRPPPPPPNQRPYFTSCPSNIQQTAPANQNYAVVTFNVQAADKEGPVTVSLKQGAVSGSRFQEGETVVSFTARDSGGLTRTCTFRVKVTVIRCPYVEQLSNFNLGSQSCSGVEKNMFGSVCRHTCKKGHVLTGPAAVTCLKSAQWSSPFPTCSPVSCGDPGKVTGGRAVCPQGHVYPYYCIVQCQSGYRNSAVMMTICGSNGQWSSKLTPCIDVEAPQFANGCPHSQKVKSGPLGAPVTVTWVDPVVTDNSNLDVTLTSDLVKGSKQGPGKYTVTLIAKDMAGNERKCHFHIYIEGKCPALQPPANGQLHCTRDTLEGSTCTASCGPGFDLRGAATLLCLASGRWDKSPSTCEDVEAPQFANGCPHSQKVKSGPLGAPVTVTWLDPVVTDNSNQDVTLTSDLVKGSKQGPGKHTVTLTAKDRAGNERKCHFHIYIESKCPALQPPANGQLHCTRDTLEGSTCTASCGPGYDLRGAATLLCLASGRWDKSPSTCEAVSCSPPPSVDHGSVVCFSGHQYRAQCWLSCRKGFQPSAPNHVRCLENATWSASGGCKDVQAPKFPSGCPEDIALYASPLGSDTVATWSPPSVSDNSHQAVDLHSDVTPGATFRLGKTTVTYEATDKAGNVASCNFSVTVKENKCTVPAAPRNGALSCHLGTLDQVCQVSCNQAWDLLYNITEDLSCNNERGTWSSTIDAVETGCVKRRLSHEEDTKPNVYHFAGSCSSSTKKLREEFVTRMQKSALKDSCIGVPSCTANNVKVFCGPVWSSLEELQKRRAGNERKDPEDRARHRGVIGPEGHRRHKSTAPRYHWDPFGRHLPHAEGEQPNPERESKWPPKMPHHGLLLPSGAGDGKPEGKGTPAASAAADAETGDCPPGTLSRPDHRSKNRFSCEGCPPDHFLPPGSSRCLECPPGQYTEQENATSCLPCPPEGTMPSVAASRSPRCKLQ